MKIGLFSSVDDKVPATIIECEGFQTREITPFEHEVIALRGTHEGVDFSERLFAITGKPRQGTSPLHYAKVEIVDDEGELLHTADIAGSAKIEVASEEDNASDSGVPDPVATGDVGAPDAGNGDNGSNTAGDVGGVSEQSGGNG